VTTDPLIGSDLGDYRPLRVLGKGGMGVVYEAEDLPLSRKVALKVLAPAFVEDATARARFQREIDHAVAIEHPHVVPVYNAGFERPHFYIAMRLIPGSDLAAIEKTLGAMPEARALRLVGQIASALHAVHVNGLVHRDVKPHNVLVWDAGEEDEHAVLTDFGIAKALDESRSITGLGGIAGTPAYMAPEVCLGQPASPASDQYSLAIMAFELLTGDLPLTGDAVSFRDAHIKQAPRKLHDALPAASVSLSNAIDRALAKDPQHRHASVREFARSIRGADGAFRESEAITHVLAQSLRPEQAAATLAATTQLTDATISRVTEIDATEVVRLRRRQARSALVGRRQR
jgi:serine/threonine protein kinase